MKLNIFFLLIFNISLLFFIVLQDYYSYFKGSGTSTENLVPAAERGVSTSDATATGANYYNGSDGAAEHSGTADWDQGLAT